MKVLSSLARLFPISLLCTAPAFAAQWVERSPAGPVYDLVIDPTDQEHLFASTDTAGRTYQESTDGGVTWLPLSMPTESFYRTTLTCASTGEVYLCLGRQAAPAAGDTFVVRQTSAGWVPFGPTTTSTRAHFASHLSVGEADPNHMALMMVENADPTYGRPTFLYLSDDGGLSWDTPHPQTGNPETLDIIETLSGPRILRTDSFWPSTGTETYAYLSDGWEPPTRTLMWSGDNVSFTITTSRTHPERLFATPYDPQQYAWNDQVIQRSDDFGLTWGTIGTRGHFSSGQRGELDPELLIWHSGTGPSGAVHISRDSGSTWSNVANPQSALGKRLQLRLTRDDAKLYSFGSLFQTHGLWVMDVTADAGTSECSALANSTGQAARLTAHGSPSIAESDLTLWGTDLPPFTAALFLTSENAGFTAHPAGSFGNLCLSAPIGRYVHDVANSGPYGESVLEVDPLSLPSPTGPVTPLAGATWRFQLWFRDSVGGQVGSHFSDAVAVTFEP